MIFPAMHTPVTDLLGIRYPIVQGGMMWVGRATLASAVSNSGGLGIVTALTMPTPEELVREIECCRALTDCPFGVNLTMLPAIDPPPYARYVEAILDSGVTVVETAGNGVLQYLPRLKKAGITVIHKCVRIAHALKAEALGADAISIDGFECAGHPGDDDVPGLILIPLAARRLRLPLIASGGIADGRGMAAALALGADGVNMGTRFLMTREAPVHDAIKQALLNGTERDTCLIFRSLRNTARVFRNAIASDVLAAESRGACFEEVRHLVAGRRAAAALASGDVDDGVVTAGLAIGLIDDIPSCETLIQNMVAQCLGRLKTALRGFHDRG